MRSHSMILSRLTCPVRTVLLILGGVLLATTAARAQAPLKNETDAVYVGHRTMLAVTAARQITISANINDFAWSPDGKKIAYLSHSDDERDYAVDVVRPDGGRPRVYYTQHIDGDIETDMSGRSAVFTHQLIGWSPDGNHLAFTSGTKNPETQKWVTTAYDINMAYGDAQPIPVPDATPEAAPSVDYINPHWAPHQDLLAFEANGYGGTTPFHVYDATAHETRIISQPGQEKYHIAGWTEGDEILAFVYKDGQEHRTLLDNKTGQVIPGEVSKEMEMNAIREKTFLTGTINAGAAGTLTLSIPRVPDRAFTIPADIDQRIMTSAEQVDVLAPDGKRHGSEARIWVVAALLHPASPDPNEPLSTAKPFKSSPRLLIDAFRMLPLERLDQVQVAPLRADKDDHASVAYLVRGDLYLADITTRKPWEDELVAAGETLTADETQNLALEYALNIADAVLRAALNNKHTSLTPDEFQSAVTPYLPPGTAFEIDGKPFHFLLTGDENLIQGSPTPIGYFDLPNGQAIGYADGHSEMKYTTPPTTP